MNAQLTDTRCRTTHTGAEELLGQAVRKRGYRRAESGNATKIETA
jgi:hypothetical protein